MGKSTDSETIVCTLVSLFLPFHHLPFFSFTFLKQTEKKNTHTQPFNNKKQHKDIVEIKIGKRTVENENENEIELMLKKHKIHFLILCQS